MALATISTVVSLASLLAIGVNYVRYQNYDPEVHVADASNVRY